MHAVRKQHEVAIVDRIDPEGGAGETGVAEGDAAFEAVAANAGIGGIDVEAISAMAGIARGRGGVANHLGDGRWLEDAHAVQFAAIQNHPAKSR